MKLKTDREVNHENQTVIKLNDAFRTSMTGGAYVMTAGIAALEPTDLGAVLHRVRDHSEFSPDTDFEDDHSRGEFTHNGQSIVWEIQYYDRKIEWQADPEDPETERVLTIMLASEE